MATSSATNPELVDRRRATLLDYVQQLVGGTLLGLLSLLAVLMVVRRWSGAIARPLSPVALLFVVAVLVLAGTWLRGRMVHRRGADNSIRARLVGWLLPGVFVWSILGSLSLPGTNAWAIVLVWAIVVAQELFIAVRLLRLEATALVGAANRNSETTELARVSASDPAATAEPAAARPHLDANEPPAEGVAEQMRGLPESVTHQLTHYREPSGREGMTALVRAQFSEGQRLVSIHLAFCPPFASVPEITADQLDGVDVSMRPVQVMAYGARIDVRRQGADLQRSESLVEIHAIADSQDLE